MLALFTLGPQSGATSDSQHGEENWEFRRVADVKVWEDRSMGEGERGGRLERTDGNWMAWARSVREAGVSWIEAKLRNDNWQGSAVNDDNVHILQEASWSTSDPSTSAASTVVEDVVVPEGRMPAVLAPSALFKVDSKIKELALEKSSGVADFGEDAPELEDIDEEPELLPGKAQSMKPAISIHYESLSTLEIPKTVAAVVTTVENPGTDLDESTDLDKGRRLVRRNSVNASSGLSVASESDDDTPAVALALSKSGKLKQIETLGDVLEYKEHLERTGEELPAGELAAVLQPTLAEQVKDVKDALEGFTHNSGEVKPILVSEIRPVVVTEIKPVNTSSAMPKEGAVKKAPGSPLFKETKATAKKNVKKSSAFSDDDSSSGEEELSDSDSDSEFEIFPPVDPKKMKLHPPVKLDIQQLEKKLGTSLSQRTRATPSKGEITEVQ